MSGELRWPEGWSQNVFETALSSGRQQCVLLRIRNKAGAPRPPSISPFLQHPAGAQIVGDGISPISLEERGLSIIIIGGLNGWFFTPSNVSERSIHKQGHSFLKALTL